MKRLVFCVFVLNILLTLSCTQNSKPESSLSGSYNPAKGLGRFQEFLVPVSIDASMVTRGRAIYLQKCSACHKLDNTQTVGPGWKGVTDKQSAAWIMNYLTNTDEMLDTDPELRKLIATGSPRMPDQGLSDDDARALLEYMRQNDAEQTASGVR